MIWKNAAEPRSNEPLPLGLIIYSARESKCFQPPGLHGPEAHGRWLEAEGAGSVPIRRASKCRPLYGGCPLLIYSQGSEFPKSSDFVANSLMHHAPDHMSLAQFREIRWRFILAAGMLIVGCERQRVETDSAIISSLGDAFEFTAVTLADPPDRPLGDIGEFVELGSGEFILSDAVSPHLRHYSNSGDLLATFGNRGSGPSEFRRLRGLLWNRARELIAVDAGLSRLTILDSKFTNARQLTLQRPLRGHVASLASGYVLSTVAGRATSLTLYDQQWQEEWTIPAPSPGSTSEYPYWNSYATSVFTASPTEVVAAYSLRYPIYIFTGAGLLIDSIPARHAAFRQAPTLDRGAFVGVDAEHRRTEWLNSFEVIAEMHIISDTLLVVTHGRLERTSTGLRTNHTAIDVYNLKGRTLLASDLHLAPETRVLGGRSALYLLLQSPPGDWIIGRGMPSFEGAPPR